MHPDKFTFQMSNYLPIWIQIKTDIEGFRLDQIEQEGRDEGFVAEE